MEDNILSEQNAKNSIDATISLDLVMMYIRRAKKSWIGVDIKAWWRRKVSMLDISCGSGHEPLQWDLMAELDQNWMKTLEGDTHPQLTLDKQTMS